MLMSKVPNETIMFFMVMMFRGVRLSRVLQLQTLRHCEDSASSQIRSNLTNSPLPLDCFVAARLAMTNIARCVQPLA